MEDILLTHLPKLTEFQKQAAIKMAKIIGFDLFIKSALFRAMKSGNTELVFTELQKYQKWCYMNNIEQELEKIKELWQRLG